MRARSRLLVALTPTVLAVGLGGAAPAEAAPVSHAVSYAVSHHAEAQVTLADGRQASIVVDEYASGGPAGRWTEVAITVPCEELRDCATGGESHRDLDGYPLALGADLRRTSLPAMSMTLHGWTDRGATQVDTPLTVSAVFTGTGPLTATTSRGTECATPSSTTCRSATLTTSRSVSAALTLSGTTSTGTGTVSSTRSLSAQR